MSIPNMLSISSHLPLYTDSIPLLLFLLSGMMKILHRVLSIRIVVLTRTVELDPHAFLDDTFLRKSFFKKTKSEMGTKKVIRKNFVSKSIILVFSFILRKYYLIYEEEDKIVLLEKGKTIDISKLFKNKDGCQK